MTKNSLFYLVFARTAIVLLGVNVLYLALLIPHFKDKLEISVANQGETFSNSTIAALSDHLFFEDYAFVVNYLMTVIAESPDIKFVYLSIIDGPRFSISAKRWRMDENKTAQISDEPNSKYNLELIHSKFIGEPAYRYTKNYNISGKHWGTISIGIDDDNYRDLFSSVLRNVFILNFILIGASLLILFKTSKKIHDQIENLKIATSKMAQGNFSSRAKFRGIDELDELSDDFNSMVISLGQQTTEINMLAKVVEQNRDAVLILDKGFCITFVNNAYSDFWGISASEVVGNNFSELGNTLGFKSKLFQEIIQSVSCIGGSWESDEIITFENNSRSHVNIRANSFSIENESGCYYFVVMADITERKLFETELNNYAFYDRLTGLANSRLFSDRLSQAISIADRQHISFSILFMDLDNFKMVNDSLGHDIGDILLQQVANRMKKTFRSEDTLCRQGGDEFIAILMGSGSIDNRRQIAEKLIATMMQPIPIKGNDIHIGISIGLASYPGDAVNGQELIRNADLAMYEVKHDRKNNFCFYTKEMNTRVQRHVETEALLRHAIRNQELRLVYQPQYSLSDMRIVGLEALIRWNHPVQGTILPSEFISIAEQSNIIHDIGDWVLDRACRDLMEWDRQVHPYRIFINISAQQLHRDNFVEKILTTLKQYGLDPAKIGIEITENIIIENIESNIEKLLHLAEQGISLAIDDFGIGYSSLSYISKYPFDVIKLDRYFIHQIHVNQKTMAIIRAVITLANSLGVDIVAEGVENIEQLEWLKLQECGIVQGFFLSQPLEISQLYMGDYQNNSLKKPI